MLVGLRVVKRAGVKMSMTIAGGVHGDIRAAHSRLAEHIAVGERLLPRRDEVIPIDRTQGLMTVVPVTAQLSWQLRQQEAAAKPCPLRIQFPLIVVTAGLLVVCDAKGAQPLVCHRLEGKLRSEILPHGSVNQSFCHHGCTLVLCWCAMLHLCLAHWKMSMVSICRGWI